MTILIKDDGSIPSVPNGSYSGGTGTTTGTTSGSTTGTSPGLVPLAIKVLFFRTGFDAESLPIERWAYAGPFARAEIQAMAFNDSGIFHPIPDGLVSIDMAQGEVVRWAEAEDPADLVDSLDAATAIEDLYQATAGVRVTHQVVAPFHRYLRAIIIGPAAGIQTKIHASGSYDHPPATMTAGRSITVTKP
ncbi:MAG TPA: hypothetical protein VJ549_00535 [Geothrix sp.]|nr:hypothetical protein [Geothrix sp.]HJV47734.1 hypothetical protein [Geothrix sp.]